MTYKGIVKFYNDTKSFGFITYDDGKEIFVHATGCKHEINKNDNVTFEIIDGKKGLNAVNVKVVHLKYCADPRYNSLWYLNDIDLLI